MVLCDAAEAVSGKLYLMGGGWTHVLTPREPVNMALGVVVAIPWDETNRRHDLRVALMDEDGEQMKIGGKSVGADGQIEVGRPAGIKPGSAINAVMAFRFNGIRLEPGGYVWELRVADTVVRTPFWVLDASEGVR